MRRARSLADVVLAALCLWAAWYHTPPGSLLLTVVQLLAHSIDSLKQLFESCQAVVLGSFAWSKRRTYHSRFA